MNKGIEKWLDNKLKHYSKNKEECLEEMLFTTTSLIEQSLDCNLQGEAIKGLLGSAVKHNFLFLNIIENAKNTKQQ